MPYSVPNTPRELTSAHHQSCPAGSDGCGLGAFVSLGSLPKRRPQSTFTAPTAPVFYFKLDGGDDENCSPPSEQDEDDDLDEPPLLKLKLNYPWPLPLNTNLPDHLHHLPQVSPPAALHFPRSSPISTPPKESPNGIPPRERFPDHPSSPSYFRSGAVRRRSATTSFSRSTSTSVFLSNGKPLKSSLKASSTPSIQEPLQPLHIRAQSAPSTPNFTPKNVHFPETDGGLETVQVFSSSAKPLSITTGGDDTETETEPETINGCSALGLIGSVSYPFPRMITSTTTSPTFALDLTTPGATSPVPTPSPSPSANVYLESLRLEHSSPHKQAPILTGTLVVRNLAFTKHVSVRFTLDEWQTTSEVSAWHVVSLEALPPELLPRTLGDATSAISGAAAHKECEVLWDRFQFSIRLEDYAHKLQDMVMWLTVRFTAGASAEQWWDNNSGQNYRVAFCIKKDETAMAGRRLALSAPAASVSATSPKQDSRIMSPTTSRHAKLHLQHYAAPNPTTAWSPTMGSVRGNPSVKPISPGEQHLGQAIMSGLPNGLSVATTLQRTAGARSMYRNHVRGGSSSVDFHWALRLPTSRSTERPTEEEESGSDIPSGGPPLPPKPGSISPPSRSSSGSWPSPCASSSPTASPPRAATVLSRPSPPPAPKEAKLLDSDSQYDAFVREWCFVQGSPPPDANPALDHSHHHHHDGIV